VNIGNELLNTRVTPVENSAGSIILGLTLNPRKVVYGILKCREENKLLCLKGDAITDMAREKMCIQLLL
jgi:hypothetical protein